MKRDQRKQAEERLKERIENLRDRLSEICAKKGHDFKENTTTKRELVGHHEETYKTAGPDCEHTHACSCPVIEKTRSVGDYDVVTTTIKRCERCEAGTTVVARKSL